MNILAIIAQRVSSFNGEYALEILDVSSQHEHEENPSFLLNKLKEYQNKEYFDRVCLVTLNVKNDFIEKHLGSFNVNNEEHNTMLNIHFIFGKPKENSFDYDILDAITEYNLEEVPNYLTEKLDLVHNNDKYSMAGIFSIPVDTETLNQKLYSEKTAIIVH